MRYDIVWFWNNTQWKAATPNVYPDYLNIDRLAKDIERSGRVAVKGRRNIGPPDDAPSVQQVARMVSR
jgi:hypothetical protein